MWIFWLVRRDMILECIFVSSVVVFAFPLHFFLAHSKKKYCLLHSHLHALSLRYMPPPPSFFQNAQQRTVDPPAPANNATSPASPTAPTAKSPSGRSNPSLPTPPPTTATISAPPASSPTTPSNPSPSAAPILMATDCWTSAWASFGPSRRAAITAMSTMSPNVPLRVPVPSVGSTIPSAPRSPSTFPRTPLWIRPRRVPLPRRLPVRKSASMTSICALPSTCPDRCAIGITTSIAACATPLISVRTMDSPPTRAARTSVRCRASRRRWRPVWTR
mmetsp:Transcript_21174/g.44694  ORF Transcript_21174/g.44694 Transcript_21174/m.44694 type:complete len:275 (+) Transcript_21174:557-1381(+)